MKLKTATRKRAKIKMALQGPSGSGKTYSSLLIAHGLCDDWSRVAVVDTENSSSDLYANLGEYNVIELCVPHSPERYTEAIDTCVKAGMEVIILDSVTHEWEFLLNYHASLQGNSFTNWSKVTPRHNAFVQKILASPCHIICTVRTKTDYVMTEKNGKQVPEKVGLKSVQRDGLDYEMTLVFDLDIKNHALASKDRTGLFFGKPEHKLSVQTGGLIADWCNIGDVVTVDEVSSRIESSVSIEELLTLYKIYPQYQEVLHKGFQQRKRELILQVPDVRTEVARVHTSPNGIHK
jgi:hypothetical protein